MAGFFSTSQQIGQTNRDSTSSSITALHYQQTPVLPVLYCYRQRLKVTHPQIKIVWERVPPTCSMATQLLSRFEREYIVQGVNCDFRADGRGCRDFRHFSLEEGVVSNTSGSAKVQLVRQTPSVSGISSHVFFPYCMLGTDECYRWCQGRDWYTRPKVSRFWSHCVLRRLVSKCCHTVSVFQWIFCFHQLSPGKP